MMNKRKINEEMLHKEDVYVYFEQNLERNIIKVFIGIVYIFKHA